MAITDLYLILSNDGVELFHQSPEITPLFNFIAIHIIPDGSGKNIQSIEAFYKYDQAENDVVSINIEDVKINEFVDIDGKNIVSKINRFTNKWNEDERIRIKDS
jgi:hypothetical protein